MRLSQATVAARDLDVAFLDGTLHVSYKPTSYTPNQIDAMRADAESQKNNASGRSLAESAANLITGWDLTQDDEHETPIGVDVDSIAEHVPSHVLAAIFRAVGKDQQTGE